MLVYRRVYCCTLHMRLRHLRSTSQFHVSTNHLGLYDFRFARLYFWSHPTTWHHMVIGVETSQDSICNIIGMNGKVVFQHPFHIFPISIPVCWFSLSQIRTEMKVPGKIPKFPLKKRKSLEKKVQISMCNSDHPIWVPHLPLFWVIFLGASPSRATTSRPCAPLTPSIGPFRRHPHRRAA